MSSKQWWTVSAVYEDNEQAYVDHFEGKTWQEARTKAFRAAESPIVIAGIFPGKLLAVDPDEGGNVVPIRGKGHAIEVSHVVTIKRQFILPARCPDCKKDLRRMDSMVETYLAPRQWRAHLSHNNADIARERDGEISSHGTAFINAVRLECSVCGALIWDGLHGQ
jgi:hypothetical protein